MNERYQVSSPAVVHEVFEDEVVIVNLDSGDYYSLSDSGVVFWNCLLAGCTVSQTVDVLGSRYEADPEDIERAVRVLIGELESADLIAPGGNGDPPATPEQDISDADKKPGFVAPVLSQYSDMRDLLLIDPIHEVDEAGWPQVKKESEDQSAD